MKYIAKLSHSQVSSATVEFEAEQQDEAEDLASNISSDDESVDWKPVDGEVIVLSVEPKK